MPPDNRNQRIAEEWISHGGTASDGTVYRAAREADPWGSPGCPLAPKILRILWGQRALSPTLSQELGGPGLTVADLNKDVLSSFNQEWLPSHVEIDLRRFLLQMPLPADTAVIPAGIPLAWLASIPINADMQRALKQFWISRQWPEFSPQVISLGELSTTVHLAAHCALEYLCVLETAEMSDFNLEQRSAGLTLPADGALWLHAAMPDVTQLGTYPGLKYQDAIRGFANWALSETNALTWGEAIQKAASDTEQSTAWDTLRQLRLDAVGEYSRHPNEILTTWSDNLDDRTRAIFNLRIAAPQQPYTLQRLSDTFGVTRERVRQLESRLKTDLLRFLATPAAAPVRWRADTIRRTAKTAALLDQVQRLLTSPVEEADYRAILLDLAGPYRVVGDWIVLHKKIGTDPTQRISDLADDTGRIDPVLAERELNAWGLQIAFHKPWLLRNGKIREFDGQLFRWEGNISDKMVVALATLGRPTDVETLLDHVGINRTKGSTHNALSADPRFTKVNRTEWALSDWGLSEYESIPAAIYDLLEKEGQPLLLSDVVTRLHSEFHVRENSIRAYCQAPAFVVAEGLVRIRAADEEYPRINGSIHGTRGVFHLGPQRVSRLLEVNKDLLRGSGHTLTPAAGAILDVSVGLAVSFHDENLNTVKITYPPTSITGPTLGSVKTLAENAGAKVGDVLTIILDRSNMLIEAFATDVNLHEPGLELASRLIGIEPASDIADIAATLHCEPQQVWEVLEARGDQTIKQALPSSTYSQGLEDALSNLRDQLLFLNKETFEHR